jgi:hypothetical protein
VKAKLIEVPARSLVLHLPHVSKIDLPVGARRIDLGGVVVARKVCSPILGGGDGWNRAGVAGDGINPRRWAPKIAPTHLFPRSCRRAGASAAEGVRER